MGSFAEQMQKLVDQSKDKLMSKTVEVAQYCYSKVVEYSPILPRSTYAKGEFVANWQLTKRPTNTHLKRIDPTKQIVIGEMIEFFPKDYFIKNSKVYITNNTPYCREVEYGWPTGTRGYHARALAVSATLSKYE